VLFSSFPFADVLPAIGPAECSSALTLVVDELTLILLLVFPDESSFSVHFIMAPFSLVLFSIGPVIFSRTANLVLFELSFVIASVSES